MKDLHILELPSGNTLKLYLKSYKNKPGNTVELINSMVKHCEDYYSKRQMAFNPHFGCKFDEIYVSQRLIFNPMDMSLNGITHSLDSADFLEPIYKNANAIAGEYDDIATLLPHKASQILQITVFDVVSGFSMHEPYFPTTKGTKFQHLYTFIVEQFFYPWKMATTFDMNLILFDMSQPNQSFILGMSHHSSFEKTIGSPFLVFVPFQDAPILAMFDAIHTFKNVRNQWYNSRSGSADSIRLKYKGIPLTWDICEEMYDKYMKSTITMNRTITFNAIHLDRFKKMRVPLALAMFTEEAMTAFESMQQSHPGAKAALFLLKITRKFFVGTFINSTKERGNLKIFNLKHPVFETLKTAYDQFIDWKRAEGKYALDVWTFAAISSIYHGTVYLAKSIFKKYGENSKTYLCLIRCNTNEVEGLFNNIRMDNNDNLIQYPCTLAAISSFNDAKNKLGASINSRSVTPTQKYRNKTNNICINKSNSNH